jgi:predicted molibdopterin-dependent oxidoreductase YjgC
MGAYATVFPGVLPISPENAARFKELWGFDVPDKPGLTAPEMLEAANRGELDVLWSVGGNFLEVLPDPERVREALSKVPLRVHQDIVLSSQMLVEGEEVILLPATTRYEIKGGVTETSTERRVIFSPEIPGPRIREARPEGEVLLEVVARARPWLADKLKFEGMGTVRAEIAKAIPLYDGIQNLKAKGDAFQYGGAHLCPDGVCPTPDGKAYFKAVPLPERRIPTGALRLVTRRGKQFNSMVHEATDPINGLPRDAVLMSASDVAKLGLASGQNVVLSNEKGKLTCRVFVGEVKRGSVQVHWPEGNVLIGEKRSPKAKIPGYKDAYVFISPARAPISAEESRLETTP